MYSAAPLVTAAKVVELTAGLAPIVAIALGPEPGRRLRNTLLMVMAMIASLIVVSVVGFWVMPWEFAPVQTRPGFVFRQTLAAPFAHPNTLSAHGAIVAVFCLAAFLSGRLPRRLTAVVGISGIGALILASGRQGVVILLVGTAVVLWALRRSFFLLLLGPVTAWTGFVYRDTLFSSLARNRPDTFATLSGRLYWWEAAITAWVEHPWTGWGYAAGGRFVALASIGSGRVSNVHSGYVETLVGVGILGIAGLAYALIMVISWSIKHLKDETEAAVLVVLLALRTAVSQGFGGWLNVEFVLFCLIVAIADQSRIETRQRRQARTQPALETI
jgi:O-antigen ligase